FVYNFGNNLLNDLLILAIDIVIGSVIVMKLYNKKFRRSLNFVFSLEIITFFLGIIIIEVLSSIFLRILPNYHFNVLDIRVHLIIDIFIFLISFAVSLRVKFRPEQFKEEMRKSQKILTTEAKTQVQPRRIEERKVILDVNDLTTYFYSEEGVVRAVERVSFKIYEGETLGLVGETGCGKSVTALSILQVVRPPGKIESGKVVFEGENLLQKSEKEILKYRGNKITMIFQDPLNSLNPVFKVGRQISEVFLLHMENELLVEAMKHPDKSIYSIARELSEQLLRDLNIPAPGRVYDLYPHELSGGMRQRIQVAMALACSPKLLIADEPTTALDVTIQNQILQLMKNLKQKYNTSILFITHDLGIISKMCDRVAVMYSGFIVEYGDVYRIFESPSHPYTKGLIASIPVIGKKKEELEVIPGLVPNLIYPPSGCRFHPRCQYRFKPCSSIVPKSIEVEPEYFVACHLYDPQYKDEVTLK
ncbi:MAG: ABC transporter ATP-binding protein, partial [Candidatus Hermodarchaeota archaeon]